MFEMLKCFLKCKCFIIKVSKTIFIYKAVCLFGWLFCFFMLYKSKTDFCVLLYSVTINQLYVVYCSVELYSISIVYCFKQTAGRKKIELFLARTVHL